MEQMTALDQLAEEFAKWREAKKSPREHAPKKLKARARALAAEFPEEEICRKVGMPRKRLFPKKREPKFIELPPVALPPAAAPAAIELEVRSGSRMIIVRLPGDTPLSALLPLLKL